MARIAAHIKFVVKAVLGKMKVNCFPQQVLGLAIIMVKPEYFFWELIQIKL